MTIIPADNMLYRFSMAGDPWPGTTGKTELSDASTPAATLYNANAEGKKLMNHSFTEISESEDGLISFIFDEDVLLGIDEIKNEKSTIKNDIYDITGRQISAEANSSFFTLHSSLKRGLYIQDGKKILIR